MPNRAAPGHVARRVRRRHVRNDPRHGAPADGGVVEQGAAAMTYRYPLPPSSNRYWRLAKGHLIVSDDAKRYKVAVAALARVDGVKLLTGPVKVTLRVFRARKSGDLDNKIKCLLDSMQGVFYENDSQVVELHAYLGDDRHSPRIEVEVVSCRN